MRGKGSRTSGGAGRGWFRCSLVHPRDPQPAFHASGAPSLSCALRRITLPCAPKVGLRQTALWVRERGTWRGWLAKAGLISERALFSKRPRLATCRVCCSGGLAPGSPRYEWRGMKARGRDDPERTSPVFFREFARQRMRQPPSFPSSPPAERIHCKTLSNEGMRYRAASTRNTAV